MAKKKPSVFDSPNPGIMRAYVGKTKKDIRMFIQYAKSAGCEVGDLEERLEDLSKELLSKIQQG